MTTTIYPGATGFPDAARGGNNAKLDGTASYWSAQPLITSRGVGVTSYTVTTVAGPTNGIEVQLGGISSEWISQPLAANVTISGTITVNLWAFESSTSANCSVNVVIEKIDGATGALTQIAKTARTTEVNTASAVNNFTVVPTSTACFKGDRFRVRVFADDVASSMASGFTFTFRCGGATAAADGDSFITFTETFTFDTSNPTGSQYLLRNYSSLVNAAPVTALEASTVQGSSSVSSVTATAAGPVAGIQLTNDTTSNTKLEWYTPPLEAVTFGGKARFNADAAMSGTAARATLRCEIAIVNNDGSGAVVHGTAANGTGELGTSFLIRDVYPSGKDIALVAGQRLRFRIYLDDGSHAMGAGLTGTLRYDGPAAAAGDSYVVLPVTVTEQVAAVAKPTRVISSRVPVMRAANR